MRQWWRVVWASEHGYPVDHQRMRHAEGLLFGHAWLDSDRDHQGRKVSGRKSAVRIRLVSSASGELAWAEGRQNGVNPLSTGLDTSYAWFGLIDSNTKTSLRSGIKPEGAEGTRIIKLAWPQSEDDRMLTVMRLIRDFGQLGARSRGGWGAVQLENTEPLGSDELLRFARPIKDCLATDWPSSFAEDAGGLMLWQGRQTFADWVKLMEFVARRRKVLRDALKTVDGVDVRAVLGSTKKPDRIANPLRWRPVMGADGQLRLRIFAMPWRVTGQIRSASISDKQLASAWQTVSDTLDQHEDIERSLRP